MNIKEQIEVMQHFADGGEVEIFYNGEWSNVKYPRWDWIHNMYRIYIKPVELEINLGDIYSINFNSKEDMNKFKSGMKFIEVRDVKNKKEFALAMLEGRKFIDINGGICYYDEKSSGPPFRHKLLSFPEQELNMCWDDYELIVEDLWYNNIPEGGILCLVWESTFSKYAKILSYKDGRFITKNQSSWPNAKPITEDEILDKLNEN